MTVLQVVIPAPLVQTMQVIWFIAVLSKVAAVQCGAIRIALVVKDLSVKKNSVLGRPCTSPTAILRKAPNGHQTGVHSIPSMSDEPEPSFPEPSTLFLRKEPH